MKRFLVQKHNHNFRITRIQSERLLSSSSSASSQTGKSFKNVLFHPYPHHHHASCYHHRLVFVKSQNRHFSYRNLHQAFRANSTSSNATKSDVLFPQNDIPLSTLSLRILSAIAVATITMSKSNNNSNGRGVGLIRLERCEGPSMDPTISASGDEIIFIERFTPIRYGLDGGDVGKVRAGNNREKQDVWEKEVIKIQQQQQLKKKKEKEEERKIKKSLITKNKNSTHSDEENVANTEITKHENTIQQQYPITWYEPKQMPISSNKFQSMTYIQTIKHNLNRLRTGIQIGDVVVLQHPEKRGGQTVCKRVLGLPGDMVLRPKGDAIRMRNRFRRRHEEEDNDTSSGGGEDDVRLDMLEFLERFGFGDGGDSLGVDGDDHRDLMNLFQDEDDDSDDEYDDSASSSPGLAITSSSLVTIPDGHIWVEGDNSLNSADSRDYGPVPASLIVGKVFCRVWPLRGESTNVMRGGRPMPPRSSGGRRQSFTGSTFLPAGYEGEKIISSSRLSLYKSKLT